jgi:cation transport regulator
VEYQNINELPPTIRDVFPEGAQEIYLEAYNRAWQAYDEDEAVGQSRETLAHQQGWMAVRHEYVLDQATGQWHRQGEEPIKQQEPKGLIDRIKSLF